MKRILFIVLIIFCKTLFADDIKKQVESSIKEVTVYTKGAQVTRHSDVKLTKGIYELTMVELTSELDAKTIQVKGVGSCTILSVLHKLNYKKELEKTAEIEKIQALFEDNKTKIDKLEVDYEVYSKEEALLEAYKIPVTNDKQIILLAGLKETLDFYRSRLTEVKQKKLDIYAQLKELEKVKSKLSEQLEAVMAKDYKPTSEIVIKLESKKDTTIDLALSYFVNDAGWEPVYDVRANSVSAPMTLVAKANVHQDSGEDWTNVKIILSSYNPVAVNSLPLLNKWTMSSYSYYCPEPTYLNKLNDNSGVIGLGALKGKITDKSTGEAIPFANIVLYQNEKQITGTTSDIDGYYIVKPITTGKYDVKVSYVGYQSMQITGIYINADKITFQDIAIAPSSLSLQEVEIVSYNSPLISADEVSSKIISGDINKMPGRSANSISSKTYGWASDKDEKVKIEEKNFVPNTTVYTATSFQYEIDLPYTIPADNKDYSVQIKEYKVPAIYEYSTAPRAITSAFLQANIVNWDEFNLMSGQANLYYEGTYLGNSYIDAKSVEDTMKISLGNDQSIIVKRERIKDFKSKKFLSSYVKESFGWEISIRNNKKEKITINVADQYPVSADKEITVELLESSGATIDEKKGTLIWKTDINPQETKKFVIKYTVKYPASYRMELE
jgi:CRISPR/Cas system CMR-associated protein Cmr5 small subunit